MKNISLTDWFSNMLIALTIILISQGCKKLEIGEPFECKIGTKYKIDSGLSFTIDNVNDSRCPINADCITSGDVDLYFNIYQHFNHIDTLIYFIHGNRNPFIIEDYTWKVLEVNPLPKTDVLLDPKDYKIKMILLKN
jgi:hypothetical protein